MNSLDLDGLRTKDRRSSIKVGTLLCSFKVTVSQLKFFTASTLSLSIESWSEEEILAISLFIVLATLLIILSDVEDDFQAVAATAW